MRRILFSTLFILSLIPATAKEGMWIPSLLQGMLEADMKNSGMLITADQIYAINKSSLKDAIVHFGGGCTSSLISDQGLLLTNHHCGYSQIQRHSTLTENYLEDGFWAMNKKEELSNPGLTATIIKEIRDVSIDMLGDFPKDLAPEEREKELSKRMAALTDAATKDSHLDAYVKPFYFGNQYFMFIVETFEDVRLVGAPPSSIGKFGYDTDNWVWPRHTGDFSIFRVYANSENRPAKYSEENVPYKPKHFLPINMSGIEADDFTMVYGFPGRTDNYVSSNRVDFIVNELNPIRVKMRDASLEVIDEAMSRDPELRLKYAAKQSRISNAWKKWIGQSRGLIRHDAVAKKQALEKRFQENVHHNVEWRLAYGDLLDELIAAEDAFEPSELARSYFVEFYYYGPEILRYAASFRELVEMCRDEEVPDAEIRAFLDKKRENSFFRNFDLQTDKAIMEAHLPVVHADLIRTSNIDIAPDITKKYKGDLSKFIDRLYDKTVFANEIIFQDFLLDFQRKDFTDIEKDPAYEFAMRLIDIYTQSIRPDYDKNSLAVEELMKDWMQAQMVVISDRQYYPDANGTLRVTYGKVEGYEPFDGAEYAYYTTLEGVMEKEDQTNPEYVVPEKLKVLYDTKDYGPYAHNPGEMRVAFIASNQTSGGNSGSPVIDARGQLIGLNFDRTWESTMSDIMFNPEICRNISVDIRYVLFIVDKFAGAGHLVQEMKLVKDDPIPAEASELPVEEVAN